MPRGLRQYLHEFSPSERRHFVPRWVFDSMLEAASLSFSSVKTRFFKNSPEFEIHANLETNVCLRMRKLDSPRSRPSLDSGPEAPLACAKLVASLRGFERFRKVSKGGGGLAVEGVDRNVKSWTDLDGSKILLRSDSATDPDVMLPAGELKPLRPLELLASRRRLAFAGAGPRRTRRVRSLATVRILLRLSNLRSAQGSWRSTGDLTRKIRLRKHRRA